MVGVSHLLRWILSSTLAPQQRETRVLFVRSSGGEINGLCPVRSGNGESTGNVHFP